VDRIYMTRVSASGVKLLVDLAVSNGVDPASLPTCGVDNTGNTHIVWKQAGALMYAKLNAVGGVLVSPFVRADAPTDYPYVDVEPDGNVHLAWVATTPPRRVKYRKLNSNGGDLGGCTEQDYDVADTPNATEYPFVMAPGSGNTYAFVSWHGDSPEFDHLLNITVAFRGCSDQAGPFEQTNDIVVGRTAMTDKDAVENAILIFERDADSPLQHIYLVTDAGDYELVDTGIGPSLHPAISALSNSQVFMVWEDRRYGTPWIFGQALDSTTEAYVGDNCRISNGLSAARRPSMARAGAAAFAVVWDDDRHGSEETYLAVMGPGVYCSTELRVGNSIQVFDSSVR